MHPDNPHRGWPFPKHEAQRMTSSNEYRRVMAPVHIADKRPGWSMGRLVDALWHPIRDKSQDALLADKVLVRMQLHLIADPTLEPDEFTYLFDKLTDLRFMVEDDIMRQRSL